MGTLGTLDSLLRYELEVWTQAAARSYLELVGEPLVDATGSYVLDAVEDADFGLLIHNGGDDPVFQYGNRVARGLFEYGLSELRELPSRLSAEEDLRDERAKMLADAASSGVNKSYSGIRVSKNGRRFRIVDAVIWKVMDEQGEIIGQAARIIHTEPVEPEPEGDA